ncbi:hypothetical protein [Stakelama saccharophila]|uniref:Uncharacterized protein n=1 Tax=Stakelama saccharophila TaxID=3075605 RepID=A0ABZ0BAE8_9SPHN|nr:hypothetical protein [Stakelama sp. W311]WNO53828.1 hypothetical protein RPR59_00790 [Stakelama sp. W311]
MRLFPIALILTLAACSSEPAQQNRTQPAGEPVENAATPAATPVEANRAAAQPAGEADVPDARALTANGWGPLKIGMTKAEVTKALGGDADPGAANGPDPETCEQYRPERAPDGMMVMLEAGRLTRITLDSDSDIETARGIGVGDTAAAVRAAYGTALTASPHKYVEQPGEYLTLWINGAGDGAYVESPYARGIRFEIGKDGKVQSIHAGGPSIQYVEGCA